MSTHKRTLANPGKRARMETLLKQNWETVDPKYNRWTPTGSLFRFKVRELQAMKKLVTPGERDKLLQAFNDTQSKMKAATVAKMPYRLADRIIHEATGKKRERFPSQGQADQGILRAMTRIQVRAVRELYRRIQDPAVRQKMGVEELARLAKTLTEVIHSIQESKAGLDTMTMKVITHIPMDASDNGSDRG